MTRISLIVPVYNVEGYLDSCLESLCSQSLSDIEIICVNDGSTDGSSECLQRWSARDSRIVVIDKPNGGPSSARNVGLASARSDYIAFPDADDVLCKDACERIVGIMDETSADVLTFGATCFPEEDATAFLTSALSPRDALFDQFSTDLLFVERGTRPFAWRTVCRRDFLNTFDIRFPEDLRLGEDQCFQFAVYPRSRRTVLCSQKLYRYRISRKDSLMGEYEGSLAKRMREHVEVVRHIFEDWDDGGFLRPNAVEMVAFALDFALYDAIKLDDEAYRQVAQSLRRVLTGFFSEDEIRSMPLPRATRRLAIDGCLEGAMGAFKRRLLVVEYYSEHHGAIATLQKILSHH